MCDDHYRLKIGWKGLEIRQKGAQRAAATGSVPADMQENHYMEEQLGTGIGIVIGLLILAVLGAIVGWIASVLVKGTGLGLFRDILLGIVGSVVGGWLFQTLGLTIGGGIIGAL
ncbi:MAG: GlsB/YeaQ/YmgE family stress response membrane protein, partial [Sedimenticolaceae bacterium]